jgi:superfamily I DNA/RNA helicase
LMARSSSAIVLERLMTACAPSDRHHSRVSGRDAVAITISPVSRRASWIRIDPPDATSDQAGVSSRDEDYLILSTIHSAKGQEWKSVFVLNVVDGCIPSDLGAGTTAEIEEERRLLYVAMTRARDGLHLFVPQRFFTHGQNAQGDRHVYTSRTRFIPAALMQHFQCVTWPLATAVAGRRQRTFVSILAPRCAACGGDPHG